MVRSVCIHFGPPKLWGTATTTLSQYIGMAGYE